MVTTLKETIFQELVDNVGDPDRLEEVLIRHRASKGPLYLGLAQATSLLEHRLKDVAERTVVAQQRLEGKERALTSLDDQAKKKQEELKALDQQRRQAEERASKVNDLLKEAAALRGMGFGEKELARLSSFLGDLAASQGLLPAEGLAIFFAFVDRCKDMVDFELETKRAQNAALKAKSDLERWESSARAAEAKSKLRMATIDLAESFVAKGVKEKDLTHWNTIVTKAGVAPEALAASLTKYGSLDVASQQRTTEIQRLTDESTRLNTEVTALQKQRKETVQAITVVRDQSLAAVRSLQQEALRYGELQRKAGTLEEELEVAKAILHDDVDRWRKMDPRLAHTVLVGLTVWARSQPTDARSAPPDVIADRNPGVRWTQVLASDLLYWAWEALFEGPRIKRLQGK